MANWLEVHAARTGERLLLNATQIAAISDATVETVGPDGQRLAYGGCTIIIGTSAVHVRESYEEVCGGLFTQELEDMADRSIP